MSVLLSIYTDGNKILHEFTLAKSTQNEEKSLILKHKRAAYGHLNHVRVEDNDLDSLKMKHPVKCLCPAKKLNLFGPLENQNFPSPACIYNNLSALNFFPRHSFKRTSLVRKLSEKKTEHVSVGI